MEGEEEEGEEEEGEEDRGSVGAAPLVGETVPRACLPSEAIWRMK